MKINKIKINSYGKIKNKEINLENHLNIIYGKNESGKSTIVNFINNILFGISRNKNGKEISDFDKYNPWDSTEYSGKLIYELDNKNKFEIFREFNKKNPKIFNEKGNDISDEYNINKKNGNEFFYEQTNINLNMYLSTAVSQQQEVKIGRENQNILIQKISNLLGTGEDNISYKKTIDKLNKLQLEKIGTERSKEKPINIIQKKIEENNKKIEELKNNKNIQFEIREKINEVENKINKENIKNNLLKEIKNIYEKTEINQEKMKIKEKINEENNYKKIDLNKKINNKNIENNDIKNNNEILEKNKIIKNKILKKYNLILFILIILNIVGFIFIPKKINNLKYILFFPILIIIFIYLFKIIKINKKIKEIKNNINNNIENNQKEINELNNQYKLINYNFEKINSEIEQEKNKNIFLFNSEKNNLIKKYSIKLNKEEINEIINYNNIEKNTILIENEIDNLKYELNKLEFKNDNIDKELENLSNLEEEQEILQKQLLELNNENESIELAKNLFEKAYEKMKNDISPEFTNKLSKIIAKITNNKYKKLIFNDEQGLIVELDNGNYIPAERLSIGTIDQLYLSLRLAMLDEITKEKMPIILDETFAYFDDERLKNILLFLNNEYYDRQIIIFTCTKREKMILEHEFVKFNYVEL